MNESEEKPAIGYYTSIWRDDLPNYECSECPWASLDQVATQEHVFWVHGVVALESLGPVPVVAVAPEPEAATAPPATPEAAPAPTTRRAASSETPATVEA